MECPVCFSSDAGAYIFTECGHSTCPQCIIRIHETSHELKCPLCRVCITHTPVIVQAFASHMPDGLVHTMAEHFEIWFRRPEQQIQLFSNNTHDNHVANNSNIDNNHINNHINNNLTNLNHEITINNAAAEEWNIITNGNIINHSNFNNLGISNANHTLPNNWQFIPFNSTIEINHRTDFSERYPSNQRKRFRRIVIYLSDIYVSDQIKHIEQYASSLYPHLNLFTEIGSRNNRMSICAHSLKDDINNHQYNTYTPRNLKLTCRGIWIHDSNVGCRWYVNDLYY